MLHDKFVNKYIVTGILVNNTPLHIGGGEDEFTPNAVDNSVVRYKNGEPFIPGSSLKGVLRSYIERILNSGYDERFSSCFVVNEECLSDKKVEALKKDSKNEKDFAEKIYDNMCTVCKIFGSKYFASKIHISDAVPIEKIYTGKRDGVAIDRDTLTAADGKKYDFEYVSPGSKFNFYMTIDNLEEAYEDILKLIINLLAKGEIKIGGKTSAGLGDVQLKDYKIYKITDKNLKKYLLNGPSDEMRWQNV